MATKNIHIVEKAGSGPFMDAYFDNLEGGGSSYVLPAATTSTLGGVKKASAVPDASDDAVVTVNALLAALRGAGIIEA